MSHHRFERLVSDLAARDGLDVERRHGGPYDGGADVIATTRELNGTAGPVHNADIAMTQRAETTWNGHGALRQCGSAAPMRMATTSTGCCHVRPS